MNEQVPSFHTFLTQILGPNFKIGEFKPHTYYDENLNFLEYIEEDCCAVTEYIPDSNIELMRKWDGEKFCGVVGIKIWGFHTVAPPEVIEAYKAYNESRRAKWAAETEVAKLRHALQQLYAETAEYIRINNLGDVHHNKSMRDARDALGGVVESGLSHSS